MNREATMREPGTRGGRKSIPTAFDGAGAADPALQREVVRLRERIALLEQVAARQAWTEEQLRQTRQAAGEAARARDEALVALATAEKQSRETSHQAGLAEMATGVIHNLGNVLNSVNVSASLLMDGMRKSKIASVAKLAVLLQDHAGDLGAFLTEDPKGSQVPAFLQQLAVHLAAEQLALLKEAGSLRSNIEHMKGIVAMQQGYARVSGSSEVVNLGQLVEDALSLNSAALSRHEVAVQRDFSEVPDVCVEKHKVLQILVNLIRNAKYACDEAGRPDKLITLRLVRVADRARIVVADNGTGILPEHLPRIFAHGFTTKKDGHGYGLHSGFQAAKELGGSLTVESDGPGKGATFTLELPLKPKTRS